MNTQCPYYIFSIPLNLFSFASSKWLKIWKSRQGESDKNQHYEEEQCQRFLECRKMYFLLVISWG